MIYHNNPEYYERMFDEHHSIMMLIDPVSGRIVDVNKAALNFYGYSKVELMNLKISDINVLTEVEVKREMENARKKLRDYFLFKHRKKNGEIRNVEVHSVPVQIDGQTLLYSIIFDVTKRMIQESYFNQVFENADDAIAILDDHFKIHNVNKRFLELFEFDRFEILHKKIYEIMNDDQIEMESKHFEQVIQNGNLLRKETYRVTKRGTRIEVEIVAYPITIGSQIVGVYAYYIDITESKATSRKLMNFTRVLENNTEGVMVTNEKGVIQWTNKAFKELVRPINVETIEDAFELQSHSSIWATLVNDGAWRGEVNELGQLKMVKPSYLSLFSSKTSDGEKTGYIGILNDMSRQVENEKMVFRLAYRDGLTNLYNRAFLDMEIQKQISCCEHEGGSLTAIFMDIDKFKQINDTLGHHVGDEILKEFSERLKQVAQVDEQVFRFGGDEFIMLLRNVSMSDVEDDILPKMRTIMRKPFVVNGIALFVEASIGASRYPKQSLSSEELIKFADVAMYTAKENRTQFEWYHPSMLKIKLDPSEIHHAIINCCNNNAFYYDLVPFYSIDSQKLVAFKAVLNCDELNQSILESRTFFSYTKEFGVTEDIMLHALDILESTCIENELNGTTVMFPIVSEALQSNRIIAKIRQVQANLRGVSKLNVLLMNSLTSRQMDQVGQVVFDLARENIHLGVNHPGKIEMSINVLSELGPKFVVLDMGEYERYSREENPQKLNTFLQIFKGLNMDVLVENVSNQQSYSLCNENGCFAGSGEYYRKA